MPPDRRELESREPLLGFGGRRRRQVPLNEAKRLLQGGAEAPRRVHPFEVQRARLPVDGQRHPAGRWVRFTLDQDVAVLLGDRVQRAEQEIACARADVLRVVFADVKQGPRKERELRDRVGDGSGAARDARGGCSGRVGV